jgi:hypothetical protein
VIIAVAALWVANDALTIAKTQLGQANQLSAASLAQDQWLNLIDLCERRVDKHARSPKTVPQTRLFPTSF